MMTPNDGEIVISRRSIRELSDVAAIVRSARQRLLAAGFPARNTACLAIDRADERIASILAVITEMERVSAPPADAFPDQELPA